MGASRFVGRVGGLAIALGVGAAWFAVGAAAADPGSDSPTASDSRAQASHPRGVSAHEARTAPRQSAKAVAGDGNAGRIRPRSAPVATPAAAAIATSVKPTTPVGPGAGAVAHRDPARVAPVADHVTSRASAVASGPLVVNPSVTWGGQFNEKAYPGLLVGTLGATSSNTLTYERVSAPSGGGKLGAISDDIFSQATLFSGTGEFFYIPDATALTTAGQTETFRIRVSERTKFDKALISIPVVGLIAPTIIGLLQQLPLISGLLAPLIGASQLVTFNVKPSELAAGKPTAFTTKVESFDGLMVSTNYFPATSVATGAVESAPSVLLGPGLGTPGITNPTDPNGQLGATELGSLTPGLPVLRDGEWISPGDGPSYAATTDFNVVSWDPRGSFATKNPRLPGMQVDAPFFEARDTSALISWLTSAENPAQSQVQATDGDPLIGMVGGSYGGGIPWTTAATDPRVDAIAPEISWNSLLTSLYPNNNQFKTGFGTLLAGLLLASGTNANSQIYRGVLTGDLLGWLSQTSQVVLANAGPNPLVSKITAPALIFQGIQDVLFELHESVANAEALVGAGTETKMVWFCGGHGQCNVPLNPQQADRGFVDNLKWLDRYVNGVGGDTTEIKAFQWYDQLGQYRSSDLLPFQDGFNLPAPYTQTGRGGLLPLLPIIGGSGPGLVPGVFPLLSIGNGSPAWNAINMTVTPPTNSQIVGAPTLTFSYQGLGTSRTVYAQLVDNTTRKVLGNVVTPIPVVLDGRERTVSIPLADIAYTTPAGGTLKLQITSSATNFENFTTAGLIKIGGITLDMPIHDQSA